VEEDAFIVTKPSASAGQAGDKRGLPRVVEREIAETRIRKRAVAAGRGLACEGDLRQVGRPVAPEDTDTAAGAGQAGEKSGLPRVVERGVAKAKTRERAVAVGRGLACAGDLRQATCTVAEEDAELVVGPAADAGQAGKKRGLPRVVERGVAQARIRERAVAVGRGLACAGDLRQVVQAVASKDAATAGQSGKKRSLPRAVECGTEFTAGNAKARERAIAVGRSLACTGDPRRAGHPVAAEVAETAGQFTVGVSQEANKHGLPRVVECGKVRKTRQRAVAIGRGLAGASDLCQAARLVAEEDAELVAGTAADAGQADSKRGLPRVVERGIAKVKIRERAVAVGRGLACASDLCQAARPVAEEDAEVVAGPAAGAGQAGEKSGLPRVVERGRSKLRECAVAIGRGLTFLDDDRGGLGVNRGKRVEG